MKEKQNEQKNSSVFDVSFLFQRPGCVWVWKSVIMVKETRQRVVGVASFPSWDLLWEFLVHVVIIY